MQIEGKHVLVTGASRGLGRALTFAFANAGATQVLAGTRKKEDEETLKAEAERLGVNVTPVHLDVRSDEDVNAAAALGGVDILVNNAAVAGYGDRTTLDFNSIQEEIEVDYRGTLRMVRGLAPELFEQQDRALA